MERDFYVGLVHLDVFLGMPLVNQCEVEGTTTRRHGRGLCAGTH